MKVRHSRRFRLLGGLILGLLVCLAMPGNAMTPLNDEHRKKALRELYFAYKKCFPEVPEVSPTQAMELVKRGEAVLVDVRPAPERAVSRLPGAVSKTEFLNSRERYQGKTIIAYDTIGYRSGLFVEEQRRKGVDLVNLREGLLGWLYAGGKIYNDQGETQRVHVYGSFWNYAPPHCETVR